MEYIEERLPDYEQVLFKNSALALSLVQLKYPPIPRFSDEQYLTGIKEAIAYEYPIISTEQGMNVVIGLQGVSQALGATLLRFTSVDSNWSVVLSNEFVSLETREYTGINDFSERFADILSNIATHFHPRHQLRLGLRYINEFRHPDGNSYDTWFRLINKDLLGFSVQNILSGSVEQTIAEVRTRRSDGTVLLRHGFLNGTTVAPSIMHPTKTGAFYLLDLDYYDETPTKFSVAAPASQIVRYNDFLYRAFRWAIGNGEFYQYLRG